MSMTRAGPKAADGFAAGVWRGVWPLLIWAAHFVVLYASVEIACELDLQRWRVGDLPALASGLWLLTAVALAVLAGFTVVGLRNYARRSDATVGHTRLAILAPCVEPPRFGEVFDHPPADVVPGVLVVLARVPEADDDFHRFRK